MGNEQINPAKVTKPIQLLAAWLAGLILINGAFLAAASTISKPEWAPGALVIASIINVPIFLASLFLLQTKFRPEMQEDEFYSKYLEKRYSIQTGKTEFVSVSGTHATLIPYPSTRISSSTVLDRSGDTLLANDTLKKVSVEINDLLPSYKELVAELLKEGIRPSTTFGSTSTEPKIPNQFVIAIGNKVPISLVQRIVKVAMHYELQGIAYADYCADNIEKYFSIHSGRIYLGAYGFDDPQSYLHMTADTLKQILSPELDESILINMLHFK